MKTDLGHIILFAIAGALAWMLFSDGCCPGTGTEILVPADTSKHESEAVNPDPVATLPPDTITLIRHVFHNNLALLHERDSLLALHTPDNDSLAAVLSDSIRGIINDSLTHRRMYLHPFGDEFLKGTAMVWTTGFADTIRVEYQHDRPAVMRPLPKRRLSLDVSSAIDSVRATMAPGIGYTDRRGRSFRINKNLFQQGGQVGASIPLLSR